MELTLEITGLNLERLMTLAAGAGIVLRGVQRLEQRLIRLHVRYRDMQAIMALCERYGWSVCVVRVGALLRAGKLIRRRPMIPAAAAMFVALTLLSSNMIWAIQVEQAGKAAGEIEAFLWEEGIRPGVLKQSAPAAALREALILRLPDLAHVSVSYAGSTLVIDCQPSLEGEQAFGSGDGLDLVAGQDGVVTRLVVHSGTPAVRIGQAVRRGDVLIRGEERGEKQTVHAVQALGEVCARVWARGDARVSLWENRTVETGAVRRRVTLCSPWRRHVIRDAHPFDTQDASTVVEPVIGLYLPLWREIETFAEITVIRQPRSQSDAASMAQGAAQQMAKNKCPPGTEILDKWVKYCMIDNEYVYATVVLEYEDNIAVYAQQAQQEP